MWNIKINIQRDFIQETKPIDIKNEVKVERFEKLKYNENIIYYIQRFG